MHRQTDITYVSFTCFSVDDGLVVKVGDATLSRDLYDLDYYQPGEKARALPVKWMSPEALEHELFTSRGDVVGLGLYYLLVLLPSSSHQLFPPRLSPFLQISLKWMSPEALEHELFTSRGDVVRKTFIYVSG